MKILPYTDLAIRPDLLFCTSAPSFCQMNLPTISPHPQITLFPFLPPNLARLMQESKIFLSSSRYKSFGLASAEAASCGCLVVGPLEIFPHQNKVALFSSLSNRPMAKLCRASSLPWIPQSYLSSSHTPPEVAQQIIRLSQSIL